MGGLNKLHAYQSAQELAKFIYRNVIQNLPPEEKWGLASQFRRAAVSIPANIAQGYGRFTIKKRFDFAIWRVVH
ncbi:MAG: four helix bundle protein [Chloroflexota bacterium]|nr:four helix bundle protein [Chloroflexota bacterium]